MYSILKIVFLNIKTCQHILLHQIHNIMIFKIASYDPFKSMFVLLSFSSSLQLCDEDERVREREKTELEEKEDRGKCSINIPRSSSFLLFLCI